MPKTFTSETTFPYPFQLSARAIWHKYPNPFATHVISVDILDQQICIKTGQLRTERILGVRQNAPRWAIKLLGGSKEAFVREIIMIDPVTKTFKMTSTNLSLSQYLLVKEFITYLPTTTSNQSLSKSIKEKDEATVFRQIAAIECKGLEGVLAKAARKVEEWSFQRFTVNAASGRLGLLSVLESMYGDSQHSSSSE